MSTSPKAHVKRSVKKGRSGTSGSASKSSSRKRAADEISVPLEHARWVHFGWALFCLILGGLLVFKLGTVGRGIGVFLLVLGAYRGYRFVRTLMNPAGTIDVTNDHIVLPLGLCHRHSVRIDTSEIGHVFFLRRAVPWVHSGPVLVIEVGETAYMYPRNWFLSEADQHRVVQAIQASLSKYASASA